MNQCFKLLYGTPHRAEGSAKEAIYAIESGFFPDIVVPDIEIQGENGMFLTKQIKDKYSNIPAILMFDLKGLEA